MSYLAIARKWRPHRFEDLVGQAPVVQTLKNAIVFERVAHAYLFCGARGIGKTSVARIFAKALRCPNAKEATPCNECPECLLISESRSVDVVEIDGASNNGVEAVRNIRDNVAYGAASGKYKIYIIDEVHMLSVAAFNALLKTLEEPPPHVVFVFATTEVQKIPLTILSRCQRFEFRRLTNQQVIERLKFILESEGLQIEENGLRTIAAHSDGSLRDALSFLDQTLSYYSEKREAKQSITAEEVVGALGVTDANQLLLFWEYVVKKDIKSLLKTIDEVYLAGVDLSHFAEKTLEELRLLYLIATSKAENHTLTADDLDISLGHFQKLEETASQSSPLNLERMAQIYGKAAQQLAWASLPRFVLEMAAIRMTKLEVLENIEKALASGIVVAAEPVAAPIAPPREAPKEARPVVTASASRPVPVEPPPSAPNPQRSISISDPTERLWKGFIDYLLKKRPLLGTLLSHAHYKIEKGDPLKLTLAFQPESFYEKQGKDSKNDIETQVKAHFGPNTQLVMSNIMQGTSESLEGLREKEANLLKKNALEHPAVEQFKNALGAEVVDVHVDI